MVTDQRRRHSLDMEFELEESIAKISEIFNEKVLGLSPDISDQNPDHDGAIGHWLERRMGIKANNDSSADLYGLEMKKMSKGKTSFGDWSPDSGLIKETDRDNVFLPSFGAPNEDGRFSWSGAIFPTYGTYNYAGQRLMLDGDSNVVAEYDYSIDMRADKAQLVPSAWQSQMLLAQWSYQKLKRLVEGKFSMGWFRCMQDHLGVYTHIQFGRGFDVDQFLQWFAEGVVILDCGMHQGNPRPYMNWRAPNSFWDSLAIEQTREDIGSLETDSVAIKAVVGVAASNRRDISPRTSLAMSDQATQIVKDMQEHALAYLGDGVWTEGALRSKRRAEEWTQMQIGFIRKSI